jgi:hypothetical protein
LRTEKGTAKAATTARVHTTGRADTIHILKVHTTLKAHTTGKADTIHILRAATLHTDKAHTTGKADTIHIHRAAMLLDMVRVRTMLRAAIQSTGKAVMLVIRIRAEDVRGYAK